MNGGDDLFPRPTIADVDDTLKIAELERELRMRHEVYPRLIAAGKLAQQAADNRILILEAVLADYRERRRR